MIGDRHHRDRLYASFIERPERGEEIRRGFDEITAPAEIDRRAGEAWRVRAEGEKRFSAARFARVEAKRRYRRIMGGELTWRGHVAAGFRRRKLAPKDRLDLLPRKGAQAKQGYFVALDAKNRGLKSERAWAAVEDHGRQRPKLGLDMGSRGRAYPAGPVGARRGDG